jgi:ribonuclease HII
MTRPTFEHELLLWEQGLKHIAGVDEVGRGCFAGPVVAAAVILPSNFTATDEINDSKKLSAKKRKELEAIIKKHALSYSIAEVSVEVINKIGVGKATQQAFVNAINGLRTTPDHILIDAFYINAINRSIQKPIVHGDAISISIAAASIIAKVYRDELMEKLHEQYSSYDFFTNKGYGTKKHQEAIRLHGLSDLHRSSFNLRKFLL